MLHLFQVHKIPPGFLLCLLPLDFWVRVFLPLHRIMSPQSFPRRASIGIVYPPISGPAARGPGGQRVSTGGVCDLGGGTPGGRGGSAEAEGWSGREPQDGTCTLPTLQQAFRQGPAEEVSTHNSVTVLVELFFVTANRGVVSCGDQRTLANLSFFLALFVCLLLHFHLLLMWNRLAQYSLVQL